MSSYCAPLLLLLLLLLSVLCVLSMPFKRRTVRTSQ
jgi:hypothetical protein